jgi:hypothetical protein
VDEVEVVGERVFELEGENGGDKEVAEDSTLV